METFTVLLNWSYSGRTGNVLDCHLQSRWPRFRMLVCYFSVKKKEKKNRFITVVEHSRVVRRADWFWLVSRAFAQTRPFSRSRKFPKRRETDLIIAILLRLNWNTRTSGSTTSKEPSKKKKKNKTVTFILTHAFGAVNFAGREFTLVFFDVPIVKH